MKLKEDLMLRNVGDEWIVIPMGERLLEFNGMIKLNETGAFIWNLLENDIKKEDIVTSLVSEYEINPENANKEVDTFLKLLADEGVLEVK